MADYYPQGTGIPETVYNRVLAFVRDYDRMTIELAELIQTSGEQDGQPKSKTPGDPTAAAAIRRENLAADIKAIDDARKTIPHEYRDVIFQNVKDRRPFKTFRESHYTHRNTLTKWRTHFIKAVAVRKGWL